ncbi:MAG TPA: hypothetical protein VFU78_22065, partial [Thermomicrobiales bacterium]|nr:hypothetical protein [Thermomicrobiales bacterium]
MARTSCAIPAAQLVGEEDGADHCPKQLPAVVREQSTAEAGGGAGSAPLVGRGGAAGTAAAALVATAVGGTAAAGGVRVPGWAGYSSQASSASASA